LSLIGVLRGPDRTRPTPRRRLARCERRRRHPAFNEADNIVPCLASVLRQTVKPRRIMRLTTAAPTQPSTCQSLLQHARRRVSPRFGVRSRSAKTPTIKRQARDLDSDVEFILDGDTVLESDNYIERTAQELYQAVGIASAFGTILPQRQRDRQRYADLASVRGSIAKHPSASTSAPCGWFKPPGCGAESPTCTGVRSTCFCSGSFYRGQLAFFGTTSNPSAAPSPTAQICQRRLFDHISRF